MSSIIKRLFKIAKSEISSRIADERIDVCPQRGAKLFGEELFTNSATDSQEAQFYANLELPVGSSLEEVRKAHKRLLKNYHPDFYGNDEEKRQIAEKIVQQLNKARNYFEEKHKG